MIPAAGRTNKIYVRWSSNCDPKGGRVLWITEGTVKDDFYGSTVAVNEKNVNKLISELQSLLEK